MKNRFATKESKNSKSFAGFFSILTGILILILFVIMFNQVGNSTLSQQKENLEIVIENSVTHCYAVEGIYPPSLDYLKSHYGLTYDTDVFLVDYQPIGSNIRPDVTVLLKN